MNIIRYMATFVVLALVFNLGQTVHAIVINFGTQSIDHLETVGPIQELGFEYQAFGAGWELVEHIPGNAVLCTFYNVEGPNPNDFLSLRRIDGGSFNFNSVYLSNAIYSTFVDTVLFSGRLHGTEVDSLLIDYPTGNPPRTEASGFTHPITELRIVVIQHGNTTRIIDQIDVTPLQAAEVPEPTGLILPALGAILLATWRRHKHLP